jgi:hypothetical protein
MRLKSPPTIHLLFSIKVDRYSRLLRKACLSLGLARPIDISKVARFIGANEPIGCSNRPFGSDEVFHDGCIGVP